MNNNTLAAAFATALNGASKPSLLPGAAKPAPVAAAPKAAEISIAPVVVPMLKAQERNGRTQMDDALLLSVLQQNVSPADKVMARRTLLRPAPWEGRIQ